ncbi:Rv3654c family TadE-like protein [Nocardia transvalensis]|uniref:Rv3654c family TadE-like protein n=1 Tax=Nocardia transvalensis TaxID=37333 RepID=UPI001892F85A|nr:Rv3654c family TadE-like protein [Nocardia transvalensis]MBF6333944.1 flp pilus-assembly TadE/G-like family protein [Nocardia transvalensis]
MTARSWRAADGAATVAACLALTALLVVTVLIVQLGAVVAVRHRAQAAADLGALAAAGALATGAETGCARADEIAKRMRVRVRDCAVEGWDATITVEAGASLGPLGSRMVRAAARAGPVDGEGN